MGCMDEKVYQSVEMIQGKAKERTQEIVNHWEVILSRKL